MPLSTEDRIIKTKIQLSQTAPFFAYILMSMRVEEKGESAEIPTMAVTEFGRLLWNRECVDGMSDPELSGTMCHEAMHMATLTFPRRMKRDMQLWNIATDIVINYLITQQGMSLPKWVLLPDRDGNFKFKGKKGKDVTINVKGKNAEQVYEMLEKNAEKIIIEMDGDGNVKGFFDKHLEGKGSGDPKDGESQIPTDAEKSENEQKWRINVTDAVTRSKLRGTLPAELERLVDMALEPIVDWRALLFQYLTSELPVDFSMRQPSRRYHSTGIYNPIVLRENLDVLVGVDISGSIGREEFQSFISECFGIATSYQQVNMRVIGWSTSVLESDDFLITSDVVEDIKNIKFKNSGGTDMSCFTKYCKEKGYKSRVYVILTDGFIESKPTVPDDGQILFVLSKNGQRDIVEQYGQVCSLNDTF